VAQRIAWLLQSRDVPLTTLPKGSTFSVRIEQITGADGETLRYGQISSVQLDAGGVRGSSWWRGRGTLVLDGSPDTLTYETLALPASVSHRSCRNGEDEIRSKQRRENLKNTHVSH
jgi:hypothetical protein